jgi:Tfp pilus assembly protein PilW
MIASVMTMVLLGATFTLINQLFSANTTMQQSLLAQQNARVAMNAISRDVTMAGTGLPDSGIPVPNGTGAVGLIRPGVGTSCPSPYTGSGCLPTPNNVIAILTPGDGVGPTVENVATDGLTIAMIDQTSPTWAIAGISTSGSVVNFAQNVRDSGTTQLFQKDLLLFNNANGSAFGCVTTVVATTSGQAQFMAGDVLNINQPAAQFGTMAATLKNPGSNPATYPPTTATRVLLITYYLDNSNTQNPRLMRSVNGNTPQVMVEGVENLQFSFDLFDYTNSTDTSNVATTANPNQIRSVRMALNTHSPDKLKRTNDYYHFGLVSKINVRNATFRNRYQ